MQKPIIGVTTYFNDLPPVGYYVTGHDYVASVALAGGCPMQLPMLNDLELTSQMVSVLDGVVLIGGGDVDPSFYGQKVMAELGGVDKTRDAYEAILIQEAVKQNKPVFGICRGLQIINVFYKGTLVQDIPSQIVGALNHVGDNNDRPAPIHDITVKENTWLHGALGVSETGVNSFHHQCIDKLAEGFVVSAVAPDGIIEGIENLDKRIVAVQFHPENMTQTAPELLRLFQTFISMC